MTTKPDPRIQNLATFLGFTTIDNIESFFNRKYQKWLFDNSHVREITKNDLENPYPKYDSEGYITNAEFSSTTKDNIPLTQKDFIDKELLILKNLETSSLPLEKKKRIEYYKNFLISKLSDTEPELRKKKPGRKSIETKEAVEYLAKFEFPENKEKFLNELKNEYGNNEPHKKFILLMIALSEMGYLKPATKNEYRIAFEKALNRKAQSKSNFNKQFEEDPDPKNYEVIKNNIREIIQSKTLV